MFVIDVQPSSESESDDEVPKFQIPAFQKYASVKPDDSNQTNKDDYHNKSIKISSSIDAGELYNKNTYVNFDAETTSIRDQIQQQKELMNKTLEETMKKSIVGQPDFERLEKVPTFLSRHQKRKQGLKERDKTKGFQWFNMPAPEMTEEKKNDLLVVQMRQALNPKHFYKRSANKTNPKYFQMGTFVESPVEFYSSRVPKKQRKQTLVEELLADAEFRQYQKKKFNEIQFSQPKKYVQRKKVANRQRLAAISAEAKKSNNNNKNKKKKKA